MARFLSCPWRLSIALGQIAEENDCSRRFRGKQRRGYFFYFSKLVGICFLAWWLRRLARARRIALLALTSGRFSHLPDRAALTRQRCSWFTKVTPSSFLFFPLFISGTYIGFFVGLLTSDIITCWCLWVRCWVGTCYKWLLGTCFGLWF